MVDIIRLNDIFISDGVEAKVYNYIMEHINDEKKIYEWLYYNKEIYLNNSAACLFLRGVDRNRKLSEFLNL
jgi:hypothetical protein